MDEFFKIMIIFMIVGLIMTIQSFRYVLEWLGVLGAFFSLFLWVVPGFGWLAMFFMAAMQTMNDFGIEID